MRLIDTALAWVLVLIPAVPPPILMTFIVNHDAVVYQTDLGPDTAPIAPEMKPCNPDSSWRKV